MRHHYGDELTNINSIFIGEHDGLNGGPEKLLFTIEKALKEFHLNTSWYDGSNVFLFGSVFSLLNCPDTLFEELSQIPISIYINVGLESGDQTTLDMLGKPLRGGEIEEAFKRIQAVNDRFANIEVTMNFVTDDSLPESHYRTLLHLIREKLPRRKSKGCVYLSSLTFNAPSRAQLFKFYRLKVQSRLPLFLYTIQKL